MPGRDPAGDKSSGADAKSAETSDTGDTDRESAEKSGAGDADRESAERSDTGDTDREPKTVGSLSGGGAGADTTVSGSSTVEPAVDPEVGARHHRWVAGAGRTGIADARNVSRQEPGLGLVLQRRDQVPQLAFGRGQVASAPHRRRGLDRLPGQRVLDHRDLSPGPDVQPFLDRPEELHPAGLTAATGPVHGLDVDVTRDGGAARHLDVKAAELEHLGAHLGVDAAGALHVDDGDLARSSSIVDDLLKGGHSILALLELPENVDGGVLQVAPGEHRRQLRDLGVVDGEDVLRSAVGPIDRDLLHDRLVLRQPGGKDLIANYFQVLLEEARYVGDRFRQAHLLEPGSLAGRGAGRAVERVVVVREDLFQTDLNLRRCVGADGQVVEGLEGLGLAGVPAGVPARLAG